jgi:hypothetical protein
MADWRQRARKPLQLAAIFLGLSLLNSAPAGAAGGPAGPPTTTVLVVNAADSPVPIAAQGTTAVTGTVNIGNSPTVTLGGTPAVAIAGTPTVALASGSSVSVAGNVIVRSSDDPARKGLTIRATCVDRGTRFSTCNLYTVQDGSRFVVESVSAEVTVDHGLPVVAELDDPNGMVAAVPCTLQGSSYVSTGGALDPVDMYSCHVLTRAYVDALGSAQTGLLPIALFVSANNEQNTPAFLEERVVLTGYPVPLQ